MILYEPHSSSSDAAINIQQLARKREERLGVLEYELRVAKEDLAEVWTRIMLLKTPCIWLLPWSYACNRQTWHSPSPSFHRHNCQIMYADSKTRCQPHIQQRQWHCSHNSMSGACMPCWRCGKLRRQCCTRCNVPWVCSWPHCHTHPLSSFITMRLVHA